MRRSFRDSSGSRVGSLLAGRARKTQEPKGMPLRVMDDSRGSMRFVVPSAVLVVDASAAGTPAGRVVLLVRGGEIKDVLLLRGGEVKGCPPISGIFLGILLPGKGAVFSGRSSPLPILPGCGLSGLSLAPAGGLASSGGGASCAFNASICNVHS